MKLKISLIFFIISILSCHESNYETIYNQKSLKISDCKNMKLVNWILLKETGLKIDQKIKIIINDYQGGIPLMIENFPLYYKVKINQNQYNGYKIRIMNSENSDSWKFYEENNELHFVRFNKFELSCKIKEEIILFGFRNVEGVIP
jgi:hypothetical protein